MAPAMHFVYFARKCAPYHIPTDKVVAMWRGWGRSLRVDDYAKHIRMWASVHGYGKQLELDEDLFLGIS
jgi:hypothetical protein